MLQIIPYVGRTGAAVEARHVAALQAALPNVHVVSFNALTDSQKLGVTVAVVANPDPADLAALPNLVWVHSLWAGVEGMLAEMPEASFEIVRLVDPALADVMAEAVLAWTLYLHRDMPLYATQQRQKLWRDYDVPKAYDQTVAILGLGALGTKSADVLKQQNFRVTGWSRSPKDLPGVETFHGDQGLTDILKSADIVVILVPLTPETTHVLDAKRFKGMKAGVQIINFARGPVIQDQDLLTALDAGHVKHAVLDVFAVEPLPQEHPYWEHPNVTVLPHISGPTDMASAVKVVAANINRYLAEGTLPESVDRTRGY